MDSLYKRQIKGKIYRLLFNMNKELEVTVKTPVGTSKEHKVGPTVTQGSIEAALISSNNLDVGVEEEFVEKDKEVKYEELSLNAQIYMYDLTRMSESVESAQYGNDTMERMINKKRLSLNMDKSCFILMGSSKNRRIMSRRLEKSPLILKGEAMKQVTALKFLSDYLTADLHESVHTTVIRRLGVAKHLIYELRTVIEDTRATKLGAMNVAFDIWNLGILPMVLHNSSTRMEIGKKNLEGP